MEKYIYIGPVMGLNSCLTRKWYGETTATSEKKARSNLAYQFKQENHLIPGVKVTLPGPIKSISKIRKD